VPLFIPLTAPRGTGGVDHLPPIVPGGSLIQVGLLGLQWPGPEPPLPVALSAGRSTDQSVVRCREACR
jgi:hypothetical protein